MRDLCSVFDPSSLRDSSSISIALALMGCSVVHIDAQYYFTAFTLFSFCIQRKKEGDVKKVVAI